MEFIFIYMLHMNENKMHCVREGERERETAMRWALCIYILKNIYTCISIFSTEAINTQTNVARVQD